MHREWCGCTVTFTEFRIKCHDGFRKIIFISRVIFSVVFWTWKEWIPILSAGTGSSTIINGSYGNVQLLRSAFLIALEQGDLYFLLKISAVVHI